MFNHQNTTGFDFRNHSIPVRADEARTAAVCTNAQGDTRLAIAARGYVLIVDPRSQSSRQVHFPDNNRSYPYASISSRNGMFYVGAGSFLLGLDPFAARFTVCIDTGLDELVGFSLTEDEDGVIYTASHPTCRLLMFEPASGKLTDLGRLDRQEDYPYSLAVDSDGWLYAGIGTEQCLVVAREPRSGEVRILLSGEHGTSGTGVARLGVDGEVYGQLALSDAGGSQPWFRLCRGIAVPVPDREVAASEYSGSGFGAVHRRFPAPWRLLRFSLPDKEAAVLDEASGHEHVFPLSYHSDGADISPLAAGPDGKLYGTSNHPMHFFRYDPGTDQLEDLGGKLMGTPGNVCAYAVQGGILTGAAYAGGFVYLIDVRKPWQKEGPADTHNPRLVTAIPEIYRPRCALAHPDGEHVIFGGYGGYGVVGGGLYIYNVQNGAGQVLPSDRLIPHHSTLCIVPLPGGDLLCGTTIEAPGGGKPKEAEARLYRLDWQRKEVIYSEVPIEGEQSVALMEIDDSGLVHAFTDTVHFVYDPQARRVLSRHNIEAWGHTVRQGLVKGGDGHIYGVRSQAIFRISAGSHEPVLLTRPPVEITAGLVMLGRRLYFASNENIWSVSLQQYQKV